MGRQCHVGLLDVDSNHYVTYNGDWDYSRSEFVGVFERDVVRDSDYIGRGFLDGAVYIFSLIRKGILHEELNDAVVKRQRSNFFFSTLQCISLNLK